MTNTDKHLDGGREGQADDSEIYGEAYYKCYQTGLGPLAYEHSPYWLSFFASIADEIIRVFQPHSVFDAGCAIGLLVESLLDRGVKAQGVDVSRYAIDNVRPDLRGHCRVASLADPIDGTFDLVTCIEVLEHIESTAAPMVISNICNLTDTVLFSSTPSDFTEPTHVNVSAPIVWIELFAANGFGPDLLADVTFLTPHAMVFRRGHPCDTASLKTYALLTRYRILCAERMDIIGAERNLAARAGEAQARAEAELAQEAQLRAEAQAHLEAELRETRAALEEERAAVQRALAAERTALEAQHRSELQAAQDVQDRQRADAQASLQAKLRAEAVANLAAETQRYQKTLIELQGLLADIHRSESWRLTRPIRLAGILLRDRLDRLRLRVNPGAASAKRYTRIE